MHESEEIKNGRRQLHEPAWRQLGNSGLGEVVGFTVAIGAVYGSEKLFPKQTAALVAKLATKLGEWRKTHPETQTELAKKIMDVGVMNLAGASSMAVQFGLRRAEHSHEEKTPLWYEAGRLAVGRIFGTITAIGSLALMTRHAPGVMNKMESGIASQIGSGTRSKRFAELLVSNAVQTVGAVAGNAPAQLLYDRLVHPPEKNQSR